MTEGGKPKSLSSMVVCDVCFELMTESRALSCLHHHCLDCTNKMTKVGDEGVRGVSCPTCRRFTPETGIQSSFMMNNLLEMYHNQTSDEDRNNDTTICKQCRRPNPKSMCVQCNAELCDNCKETHLEFPLMIDHTIVAIGDVPHSDIVTITKLCSKHPGQTIAYNCTKCNQAGCTECMIKDHNGHVTESVEEALDAMVASTKKHVQTLNKHNLELKQKLDEVEENIRMCTINRDFTKIAIQDQTKECLQNVDDGCHTNLKQLEITKCDLENELASQESLVSWTNTVISMKGPGPLCELQEGLYQQIESCAKQASTNNDQTNVQVANFTPSEIVAPSDLIGEIKFIERQDIPPWVTPNLNESSEASGWQVVKPKQLQRRIPEFSPFNCFPEQQFLHGFNNSFGFDAFDRDKEMPSFRQTNINLEQIAELPVRGFNLKRHCERLSIVNHTLWCPRCFNSVNDAMMLDSSFDGIDVYSLDGKFIKSIHTGMIQGPRSVHLHTDGHVLVAAAQGLIRMTTEGKDINPVIAGHFYDVHINKDVVVALKKGHRDTDVIYVLDNIEFISAQTPFAFGLENDCCTSVMLVGDHIYASFYGQNRELISYITKYTLKGDRLGQYGQIGHYGQVNSPGHLACPYLCVSDTQQSVLVADCGNNRLQILDKQGKWSIKKLLVKEENMMALFAAPSHCILDVVVTPQGDLYALLQAHTDMFSSHLQICKLRLK